MSVLRLNFARLNRVAGGSWSPILISDQQSLCYSTPSHPETSSLTFVTPAYSIVQCGLRSTNPHVCKSLDREHNMSMSSPPFLPSTLPLLPLPPSQVLYPNLQVSISLLSSHLSLVLISIAENAKAQKVENGGRMIAVVPVVEIERRVGRWACGE